MHLFALFLLLPLSKAWKCGGDLSEEEEIPPHKRHLFTRSDTLSPIRVYFHFYEFDLGSSTQNTYFTEEILPAVKSFITTSLKVYPLSTNLILSSDKCLSNVIVPEEHKTVGVEADLIIYVTVNNLTDVNYVAFAGTCERQADGLNNVLAGTIVINIPNFSDNTFWYQFTTITHEITHILGFARTSYKYWKNSKGEAYEDGTMTKNVTVRGVSKYLIVTPTVLKKAKEAFNCDEIEGIELEEEGGDGTANAHWDRRILINDYMTSSVASDAIWSTVTLALLQDTGWYTINFTLAVAPIFGKDQGCDFFTKPCLSDGKTSDSSLWCDTKNKYSCDPFALNKAHCNIKNYTSALPVYFQYFPTSTLGGSDEYPDYCPYADSYSNGACRGNTKTTVTLKKASEVISINSRCFESTLYLSPSTVSPPYSACYEVIGCNSDSATVRIGDQELECPFTGGVFSVDGYTGNITCPASGILCENVPCKELCRGRGSCKKGVCSCFDGFGGDSCSVVCGTGCKSCNSTQCLECDEQYQLLNGNCTDCPTGCKACNDSGSCGACLDGFYLSNASCYQCVNNCLSCEDEVSCVECEKAYFVEAGGCKSCGEFCGSCDGDGMCVECEHGYEVKSGVCVKKCVGDGCVKCDTGNYLTDLYVCDKCQGGYCGAGYWKVCWVVVVFCLGNYL